MNYWHMQLHPNDRGAFGEDEIWEILQKGVIGLIGTDFETSFRFTMKVGDIVVIRPILALVEIISDVYDIEKGKVDADVDWFTTRRNVRVLPYDSNKSNTSNFNKNVFLPVTGAPLSGEALRIAKTWYQGVIMQTHLSLLKTKKQIILQGAPGTGKTYSTAELAVGMIKPPDKNFKDRKALMDEYQKLVEEKRVFFTTFHPSLDYEDFVEGYKPKETGGILTYSVEDGIFKQACSAADLVGTGKVNFDMALAEFVEKFTENPNHSESYNDYKFTFTPDSKGENHTVSVAGKNLAAPYPIAVKRIKTIYDKKEINKPGNNYPKQVIELLEKDYKLKSWEDKKYQKLPVILIIDEINRGNISKIFGELITLLEADKRKGAENCISASLPYSGNSFTVPPNLYIIGTMNTADRSIGTLDYALRRRFAFVTIEADEALVSPAAKKLFNDVKALIDDTLAADFEKTDLMIGHSYFMAGTEEELQTKLKYEIKPLLKEYLRDGILIDKDNLKQKIDELSL